LLQSYADPLRRYARSKDSVIISSYDASTLFGNIDQLLIANEAFLTDLEKMVGPNGHKVVGGIGDVALKHVRPTPVAIATVTDNKPHAVQRTQVI
jgi:hypothetical protein